MSTIKWISKYTLIFFIGIMLAFFVSWIQYDTKDLSASVLSISEQDFFEASNRDAWYKKEHQIFEVFLADQIRNEGLLTVSILYSPEDVELFLESISTPYSISNINQKEGNLTLDIDWYSSWNFSQWIFEIPYSWDSKNITLEYIKSKNSGFSIWNLDSINTNGHH